MKKLNFTTEIYLCELENLQYEINYKSHLVNNVEIGMNKSESENLNV
jgi:hypothetical protein